MENKNKVRGLGAALIDKKVYVFFCSDENIKRGTFTVRESEDGITFTTLSSNAKVVNINGPADDLNQCDFFHVTKDGKYYYLTYRISTREQLCIARSKNLIDWEKTVTLNQYRGNGKIVFDYLYAGRNVMFGGGEALRMYVSEDLVKWRRAKKDLITFDENEDAQKKIFVVEAQVVDDGIFVMYAVVEDKQNIVQYNLHAALFDYGDPTKLLWQSQDPIYSTKNTKKDIAHLFGIALFDEYFVSYWFNDHGEIFLIRHFYCHGDDTDTKKEDKREESQEEDDNFALERVDKNPIMTPQTTYTWESKYVFNPAAIYAKGRVHIVYRAIGDCDISVFGYATSTDGIVIDERQPFPAYVPRTEFEGVVSHPEQGTHDEFVSGGGAFGGCEDPKLTYIDDKIYLVYVAYNGWSHPRLAMAHISAQDFFARRWKNWSMPVLISRPGQTNKSGCILPEKINGKYVIFHRMFPNIKIDFVDSLNEFDGKTRWLEGQYEIPVREGYWDAGKISVAAPPVRTDDGWLMIYHAVTGRQEWEGSDLRYKIGAMLLDINDPTKVIARTNKPLLEPETPYENEGAKYGIAYPCGCVVRNDTLLVYYGGSDEFVCVAKAPLGQFLDKLKRTGEVKMTIN